MTATTNQLRTLRREAAEAGDLDQEALCVLALGGRDELADAEPGTAWAELYATGMTQEQAISICSEAIEAAAANTATSFRCVSDRYEEGGASPDGYASVEDFLSMCRACFGEAPQLRETSPGRWFDDKGLVLVERADG